MIKVAIIIVVTSTISCFAFADEATTFICGSDEGHAYYMEEGIVEAGDGGWEISRTTNGKTVHTLNTETGKVGFKYFDATKKWYDPVESGEATTLLLNVDGSDASWSYLTMYGGLNVEVRSFALKATGEIEMMYTQHRNTEQLHSGKLMIASCSIVE